MSRILLICPIFAPYPGGGGSYFPLLVKLLKMEGEDVNVLTEYYRGNYTNSYGKLIRILLRRDTIKKNFAYSVISYFINFFIIFFYLLYFVVNNPTGKIIFTRYYSRIHLLSFKFIKLLYPRVIFINDLRTEIDKKYISNNFNFVDKTISNSKVIDIQINEFPNLRGDSYIFVPNFLELPTERDIDIVGDLLRKKFVLFVGTLSHRKGFDKILLSINNILRDDEIFVIVGREFDISHKEISKYLKHDKFIYFESLNKNKVFWLQKNANLVLLPSIKEGLPRVALETFCFHGRIVLPTCCPEFFQHSLFQKLDYSVEDLVCESHFRRENPYLYDVSIHTIDKGFKKYFDFIKN